MDALLSGQPATFSSSLTPKGTPPNGRLTSARTAASRARSKSVKLNALSGDLWMAAMQSSSASAGESSPARNASTRLQASPNQGVLTRADSTRAPERPPGPGPRRLASLSGREALGVDDARAGGRSRRARRKPAHDGR